MSIKPVAVVDSAKRAAVTAKEHPGATIGAATGAVGGFVAGGPLGATIGIAVGTATGTAIDQRRGSD